MLRIATTSVLLLALAGCTTVSHRPISQEALLQLSGKTVAVTQYEKPDFVSFTAGKAAFAMLGAAAMISEGNEIVRQNDIPDPAIAISTGLAERLRSSKLVKVTNSATTIQSDDVSAVVAANPEAQYILDYKTTAWMFNYYPTDWSHYRVTYSGRLRFIDAASKSVIAESACSGGNPPAKPAQ